MTKSPLIIIEDNQDDYEALTRSLKDTGFERPIKWFNSTANALTYFNDILASKEKLDLIPCLIILDLNMPGIDGREMLSIIRQIEDLKATPIVIFTTSADKKDIQQCYEAGANSYIQKPVSYIDLKKHVKQFFEYWFDCALIPNHS